LADAAGHPDYVLKNAKFFAARKKTKYAAGHPDYVLKNAKFFAARKKKLNSRLGFRNTC
jgi:hypothetical protein